MRKFHKSVSVAVAAAAAVVFIAPSTASAGTGVSVPVSGAITVVAQDYKSDVRTRFQLTQTPANVIKGFNGVYSTTNGCENCNAAAISFQVIVSTSNDAVDIKSRNEARAVSRNCVECTNLAAAFQFIVANPPGQRLSSSQQASLASVQDQLKQLQSVKLADAALNEQVEELAGEVVSILQNDSSQAQRSAVAQAPQVRPVTVNRQVEQAG